MKRKMLALCLLLSAGMPRMFAGDINALRVHCRSGEDVTILLEEEPVVRFEGLDLVIATDKNVVNFPSAEAEKFTYVDVDPNGISNAILPGVLFSFGEESLNLANLAPDSMVGIYTVDGILVSSAITDLDGSVSLMMPGQAAAVYIVKTPTVSFKIIKP